MEVDTLQNNTYHRFLIPFKTNMAHLYLQKKTETKQPHSTLIDLTHCLSHTPNLSFSFSQLNLKSQQLLTWSPSIFQNKNPDFFPTHS